MKHHLAIVAGTNVWFTRMIGSVTDARLTTQTRPGAHLGVQFRVNVHNKITVSSGVHFGLQSLKLHYQPSATNGVPVDMLLLKPYLAIPIEVLGRLFIKPRHFIEMGAGVSLYMYLAERNLVRNVQANGDVMELEVNTARAMPLVNMDFKIGYGMILQNLNAVVVSLEFGKSFSSLMQANYRVRDNDLIYEQGTINARNDLMALRVTYLFTRAKGMIAQTK